MNSSPVNHVHICEDVELVYKSKLIELQKVASLSCHVISLLQEKEKELLKQSNQIKMLEQQLSECKVVDQNLSGKGGKSKTIEADSGICSTKSFSTLNSLLSSVVEDGDGVLTPRAPDINNPAPTKVNRNQNFQPTVDDLIISVRDRHLPENSIPREPILQKVQQNVNDNRVLTSMSEFWAFTSNTSDQNFTSVVRELKKTKTLLSVKLHDRDTKIDDAMVSTNIKETMRSLESENEKLKAQIKELHMFKSMVRKEQEGVSVFLSHESSQASAGTRKSESFDLQNDQHQTVSPIPSCGAKQGNTSVEHKIHKREHNQGQNKQGYSSARYGEKSVEHEIHKREHNQGQNKQGYSSARHWEKSVGHEIHKNEHNQGQKNEEYTPSNVNLGHMQKEKQLQDEINTLKMTCEKLNQENQALIRKNKKLMSNYEALLHSMQTVEQQCEEKYTTDTLKHKKQQDEFKKQQEQYKKQLEEYRKQLEECRKQLEERRKQLEEYKKQQEETESCNKDLLIHVEKLEQEKSRKLGTELFIGREKQQHLLNLKDQDQQPLKDRKHLPLPHYYPSPPPHRSHGSSSHSSSSAVFNQVTRQPVESPFVQSDRVYQTPITKYECERCLLEFTDKMEHLEHLSKCLD